MIEIHTELPANLKEMVGEALRVVATHDEDVYQFHYQREDIRKGYSDDEFSNIFHDLVLQGMSREYFEKLFHVGHLECGAWGFDYAAIFYFPVGEYSGLVVSIDRDSAVDFDKIINTCKAGIEIGG